MLSKQIQFDEWKADKKKEKDQKRLKACKTIEKKSSALQILHFKEKGRAIQRQQQKKVQEMSHLKALQTMNQESLDVEDAAFLEENEDLC